MDALWATDDPQRLAEKTVAQASRLLPGLIVALAIAEGEPPDIARVVAGTEDWCAKELPVHGSIAGEAMRGGRRVEKAAAESVDRARLLDHGVTTLRALPLLTPATDDTGLAAAAALLFMTRDDGRLDDAYLP